MPWIIKSASDTEKVWAEVFPDTLTETGEYAVEDLRTGHSYVESGASAVFPVADPADYPFDHYSDDPTTIPFRNVLVGAGAASTFWLALYAVLHYLL